MTLWLAIPLALLLLGFVLILSSSIDFHFRLCRLGKDDRVELDVRTLFGWIRFHYELPKLVYEGIERGVKVKLEESGVAPIRSDKEDNEEMIDKEKVSSWLNDIKKVLKATYGFKKWFRDTLAHVKITKLDWSTDFSLGDAAGTATAAGALWGMKWCIIGWISQWVKLKNSPRLFVKPVFQDDLSFSTELVCTGEISVAYGLYAGASLLIRALRVKGGLKHWKQLLGSKHRKSFAEAEG